MVCNWANASQMQELVQHQGLLLAVGGTVFGSTADTQLTFAPTNTCDSAGAGFRYSTQEWTDVMDNDNANADAVTNNLTSITTYETNFTMPTQPSSL